MEHSVDSCPLLNVRLNTVNSFVNQVNRGLSDGKINKKNLIWLELNGCSGNIISLLNGGNPGFGYLITDMVNLYYNNSLMAAEGEQAIDQLLSIINTNYILAVEGAVSAGENGAFHNIGRWRGNLLTDPQVIKLFAEKASHVIAVGACAVHGGFSAARPNPTGCAGVESFIDRKVINLPGCPCHPDWFTGTLAYILLYGEPPLDSRNRPMMFYSATVHDRCTRRAFFDQGVFATSLGEKTCMFKLGCRGPVTPADCPYRKWNQYVNWPVEDDSPCIGCAQFGFPDAMEPFITYENTQGE